MVTPQSKMSSWNINGSVIEKLPFLESSLCCNDVLCLQEHFLTASSVSVLKLTDYIQLHPVPAISSENRETVRRVAILINSRLATQLAGED